MSETNGHDKPTLHGANLLDWIGVGRSTPAPPPIAVPTSNGVAMIAGSKTGTTSERVVKMAGTAIFVMVTALVCVFLAWVMATMIRDIVGM